MVGRVEQDFHYHEGHHSCGNWPHPLNHYHQQHDVNQQHHHGLHHECCDQHQSWRADQQHGPCELHKQKHTFHYSVVQYQHHSNMLATSVFETHDNFIINETNNI